MPKTVTLKDLLSKEGGPAPSCGCSKSDHPPIMLGGRRKKSKSHKIKSKSKKINKKLSKKVSRKSSKKSGKKMHGGKRELTDFIKTTMYLRELLKIKAATAYAKLATEFYGKAGKKFAEAKRLIDLENVAKLKDKLNKYISESKTAKKPIKST